jgi:nitroimidazol reductase NimA-like FMN-containing flavoprotein (pyridoxamine 5'-phosphate oxidase superfamily)
MEAITAEQARRFLDESLVAHIGVISAGVPYVTPMSFVVDSDRILFRTKPGKRHQAMMENPAVSIEASTFDNERVTGPVSSSAEEQPRPPTTQQSR